MGWKTGLNSLLELSVASLHASLVHLSGSIKENVINFQPNPY